MNKIFLTLVAAAALCGCGKNQTEAPAPAPAPAPPKPALVSAEKNSFNEVTSKLDPGGDAYMYLSTERLLKGLDAKIAAASNFLAALPVRGDQERQNIDKAFTAARRVILGSGIEKISGIGSSSIVFEPGWTREKFVIHHYSGPNDGFIWTAFGQASHPLAGLDLLPETTVLATFSDFDAAEAWGGIASVLRSLQMPQIDAALDRFQSQFEEKTGVKWDNFIASFGGEFGMLVTFDDQAKISIPIPTGKAPVQIPEPGLAFVFRVKSDVIFDRVATLLTNQPLTVNVDEPNLKARVVPLPLPLPISLRPTIARSGDYLFLASNDKLVREMLAVKSGDKKGFKSTDEFKKLSRDIPLEGNSFVLLSSRFGRDILQAQRQFISGQDSSAAAAVQQWQNSMGGMDTAGFVVGAIGPEGWISVGNKMFNAPAP